MMPKISSKLAARMKPNIPWIKYRPQLNMLSNIDFEKASIETWMEVR